MVLMPISQSSPMLLTRNLLYTGMTRAKKLLIIIGNKNIIEFMIKNTEIKKKEITKKKKKKNNLKELAKYRNDTGKNVKNIHKNK